MSGAGGITTLVSRSGEVASVGVFGELDLYTGEELNTVLVECLDQRPALLVVDVSGVSFCDLTGVTALAAARDTAEQAGTEFVLSGVKAPALMRIFALTGLDAEFGLRQQGRCSSTRLVSAAWKTEDVRRRQASASAHHEPVLGRRPRYVRRTAVNLWRLMAGWRGGGPGPVGPNHVVWRPLDCGR